MVIPSLREMIARVVAEPSVSSVHPGFDQGNRAVIAHLAEWLEALGFRIEIQDLPGHADKANLIATLGPDGDEGLIFPAIPTRCRVTPRFGAATHLP